MSRISSLQGDRMAEFKARAYQLELYEHAKKQNSILVLGTGSGKTFISILLIKELGHQVSNEISIVAWETVGRIHCILNMYYDMVYNDNLQYWEVFLFLG